MRERVATAQLRAERELHAVYDQRAHLERPIQERLYDTVEEHLQELSAVGVQRWLHTFRHSIKGSMKRARLAASAATRSIRYYFSSN